MDFWHKNIYLEVGSFYLSAHMFLSVWTFRYMFQLYIMMPLVDLVEILELLVF
jgi:hypothetical protein